MSSITAKRVGLGWRILGVGVLAILGSTAMPLHAVIGDTPEQLFKRYGAGKSVGGQLLYKVDAYSASIYFDGKKSTMEIYSRLPLVDGTHEELTEADVQKLLAIQGGNQTWNAVRTKKGDKTWSRQDGKVLARFKPEDKALVFVDAALK